MFLAGGILISLVCNNLLLNFSKTLGIRNKNDITVRWSNQSKPSLGGISFFVAFIFGTIVYAIIVKDENIFRNLQYVGFIAAASLAFLMGLADDAFNTRPMIKLSVQILCGVILALSGTQIHLFNSQIPDIIITVLWTVILMNSLNMLDNMDGITGTTVLFILLTCLINQVFFFGLQFNLFNATITIIIGALIGFLRYNLPPSKIFMGDAGSQFIALVVAYFTIPGLWQIPDTLQISSWYAIPIVLVAFTPAASDTLTVFINRIKRGQSPLIGGKDHTTHHLVYAGKTEKNVWQIFLLFSFLSCLISVITSCVILPQFPEISNAIILFFIVVFIYLYRNTIRYKSF